MVNNLSKVKRALFCMALALWAIDAKADALHDKMPFIAHDNTSGFYWLAMNINPKPVKSLLLDLEAKFPGLKLLSRGETHITVITPPEYANILKPYLTAKEIDDIAVQANIQSSQFTPLCIGKGIGFSQNKQQLATYFIEVESSDLLNIRKKIFDAYVSRGGIPSRFDPQDFTPHITIGFTERDLFEKDGVYKQANACIMPLPK